MSNHIPYIREVVSIILALAVLDFFSRHFYHLSLFSVMKWWFLNFYKVENVAAYAIGLLFNSIVYFLIFSAVTSTIYLGLFGKNQELVYLGNDTKSHAVYFKKNDNRQKLVTGYDTDREYNFSFNNLLIPEPFVNNAGNTNAVGLKSNHFSLLMLLAKLSIVLCITLVTLWFYNAIVYQVYTAQPTQVAVPSTDGAQLAMDWIVSQYHLTRGKFILVIFGSLFGFFGFVFAAPANNYGKRIEPLPSTVQPGKIISGVPKEIKIRYTKRYRNSSNRSDYDWVDTGDRYINFEFSDGFRQSVYVATLVNIDAHRDLISEVERNIRQNSPIRLQISDELSITVIDQ